MPVSRRPSLTTHASLALIAALAAQAGAQSNERFTYTISTQYKASGIKAYGGTSRPTLIGPTVNVHKAYGGKVSVDIPAIDWGLFTTPPAHLGQLGAEVRIDCDGQAGIQVTPKIEDGLLDYTYNALVGLNMPRYPNPGEQVTVQWSVGATASFLHTTAPTLTASFDAIADFRGSLDGKAYFFKDDPFASGFHPFEASATPYHLADLNLGQDGAQGLIDSIQKQLALANPIPISISAYIPVLAAGPSSVDSTGTINARGFAKFLTLETSLLDLMLAVIPEGNARKAIEITQGDYTIPGTDFNINWAIAKTAANMDVGLDGRYSLAPSYKNVTLDVRDRSGKALPTTVSGNQVTFTMPQGGVSITPTVTEDFLFTNRVGVNIQGSVGFYPFSGGAKGSLGGPGSGTDVDFQFDVTPLKQNFNPVDANSSLVYESQVKLDAQPDRTRTLAVVGLNAYSPTDLPSELSFKEGPRIANLHAYGEGDGGDLLLEIYPEQGRQFFLKQEDVNTGKAVVVMHYPDGVRTLTTRASDGRSSGISMESVSGSKIVVRVPVGLAGFELARGIYDMTLRLNTVNTAGQAVAKNYDFPLQVYAHNPEISGQFNTRNDLSTQTYTYRVSPVQTKDDKGNLVVKASTEQTLYFNSRFVLKDTVMVIDNPNDPANPYILPVYKGGGSNGATVPLQDSGVYGIQTCAIRLSNALVQELGGVAHRMQLRTPGTGSRSDGTAYNPAISTPTEEIGRLFFIADKPRIDSTRVDQGAGFGDASFWVAVSGANFAQSTEAYLKVGQDATRVNVGYGSPTSMRVEVPADFIRRNHERGNAAYTLYLHTPPFDTPSNDTAGVYHSGGDSKEFGLELAYPAPSVEKLSPAKVVRDTEAASVRVAGSSLFRYSAGGKATIFAIDGQSISPARVAYPASSGIIVPYVDVPIPASIAGKNGTYRVTATNASTTSVGATFTVENGAPKLGDLSQARFRVGPGYSYAPTLTGAPFYKDATTFLLNGSTVTPNSVAPDQASLKLDYDLLRGISASAVKLTAFTAAPGGGTSNAISVALEEGDPGTVKVVPGALVFDRASNAYKQSFAVTYVGARDVSRGAQIRFPSLGSGVTLQNASGTANGAPYLNTSLVPRRQVTIVATFKKSGTTAINSSTAVGFAD